jgi:nucleotide-binding universal stress UspA family protein
MERIVVGTDGSETAEGAVRAAAELAEKFGAELHAVSAPAPGSNVKDLLDRVSDKLVSDDVDLTTHEASGDAAEAIIGVAEDVNADLIVVGSRGMSGVGRYLLGSVPDKVSHHAPCTVLIVRTTEVRERITHSRFG